MSADEGVLDVGQRTVLVEKRGDAGGDAAQFVRVELAGVRTDQARSPVSIRCCPAASAVF